MFLNSWRQAVIAGLVFLIAACATNYGDLRKSSELAASSNWVILNPSADEDSYYDPYQTIRDGYGNIETVVWGKRKTSNLTVAVLKAKINCDKKIIQLYRVTSNGNWELYQDWASPDPMSARMGWIMGLCGRKSPEGDDLEFINWNKLNANSDLYYAYYWYKNKEYNPSVNGGKTFKVFYHRPSENSSYYTYFYADCNNKKYALSSEQKLKDVKWEAGASPSSGASVLFYYACGTKLSPAPTKPPTKTGGTDSIDLNDAKTKCAELGFKKGTDQFGNCVLKLTK